jgi:hypothetical protein
MHVERVDPRHMSQMYSRCGYQARGCSQSLFHCRSCGYELNADLNAAYNIRDKYGLTSGGTPVGSETRVNQPFVSDLGLGTSHRPFRHMVVDLCMLNGNSALSSQAGPQMMRSIGSPRSPAFSIREHSMHTGRQTRALKCAFQA